MADLVPPHRGKLLLLLVDADEREEMLGEGKSLSC